MVVCDCAQKKVCHLYHGILVTGIITHCIRSLFEEFDGPPLFAYETRSPSEIRITNTVGEWMCINH